ncbi:unnamed protein product, partial [marine sediment metagenome]
PLIECMSCGVPCIATNYSGPTEYLNENNHITLPNTKTTIASDGVFFNGTKGTWEVPSIMSLAETMKQAIDGKIDTAEIIRHGRETALEFSWENAAVKTIQALQTNELTEDLFAVRGAV